VRWSAFTGSGGVLGGAPAAGQEWVFLAVVYDQDAQTIDLYVEDELFSRTGVSSGSGHATLRIGDNPSFNENFSGLIDNVFFFDEALDASQIEAIRNGGASALAPVSLPGAAALLVSALALLGHWKPRSA
jgi:hypothetical protein